MGIFERKKVLFPFEGEKKKTQVTVLEPPKQPPPLPRLENLTAPVQMGLSGILSLHIHIKKYQKDPSGDWHLVLFPQGFWKAYLEKPLEK